MSCVRNYLEEFFKKYFFIFWLYGLIPQIKQDIN